MTEPRSRTPLSGLLTRAIHSAVELAKAELTSYKKDLQRKLKESAAGIGLLTAAGLLGIFALAYLVFAGYQGLAVVVAPWLAALLTAAALLLLVAALAWGGVRLLGRHEVPNPAENVNRFTTEIKDAASKARTTAAPSPGTQEG